MYVLRNSYALIGSRRAPVEAQQLLREYAVVRARQGMVGFSGGADNSDEQLEHATKQVAIEQGYRLRFRTQRIFLPDVEFNGRRLEAKNGYFYITNEQLVNQATDIAARFHPSFSRLSEFAKKLMIRNSFQVLGHRLVSPVDHVICFTPDGSLGNRTSKDTGGTGQALRIAYARGIPVYNIGRDDHYRYIKDLVKIYSEAA